MTEELKKFRMPAEWEPQKSVWIAWPYNKNDWPGLYKFIPKVILEIIFIISKSLKVNLIFSKKKTNIKSPGMMKKHYSPGIPVILGKKPTNQKHAYIVFGNKFANKGNYFNSIIINFLYLVLIIPGLYFLYDPQLSRYWFFILLLIYLIIYSRLYRLTKN